MESNGAKMRSDFWSVPRPTPAVNLPPATPAVRPCIQIAPTQRVEEPQVFHVQTPSTIYTPFKSYALPPMPFYERQKQPIPPYELRRSDSAYGGSDTMSESDMPSVRNIMSQTSDLVVDPPPNLQAPLTKNIRHNIMSPTSERSRDSPLNFREPPARNLFSPPSDRSRDSPPNFQAPRVNNNRPTTSGQSRDSPLQFIDPAIRDTDFNDADSDTSRKRHSITRYMSSITTDPPNTQEPPFKDTACDTSDNLSDSDFSVLRHNTMSPPTDRSKSPPPDLKDKPETSSKTANGEGVLIKVSGSPTEIALSIVIVLVAVWVLFGSFSSSGTPVCESSSSDSFGFVSFIVTFVVMFVAAALVAA